MSDFEIAFTDEAENLPAVKEVDEGLQPHNVDEMLMEIRNQPNWRITADVEADYYDGNQLDQETLDLYAERGQAPLIENLIKPMIDVVLGMEAKTRTDWKVRPGDESDEDMTEDVADALSVRLHRCWWPRWYCARVARCQPIRRRVWASCRRASAPIFCSTRSTRPSPWCAQNRPRPRRCWRI